MVRQGSEVKWKWGNGYGSGKVIETYDHTVTFDFAGQKVIRHGETGNKALLIEQSNGTRLLKLESEVENVNT